MHEVGELLMPLLFLGFFSVKDGDPLAAPEFIQRDVTGNSEDPGLEVWLRRLSLDGFPCLSEAFLNYISR